MRELFDKIAQLPDIHLSRKECHFIALQFSDNEKLTGRQLCEAIKQHPALGMSTHSISQAVDYINGVAEIIEMLVAWKKIIFQQLSDAGFLHIPADILVPLIIALIPDDYNYKLLLPKFDLLQTIAKHNAFGYWITTLNSAINFKLSPDHARPSSAEETLIMPVVERLQKIETDINRTLHSCWLHKKLENLCEKNRDKLYSEIILSIPDDFVYYKDGIIIENKAQIATMLLADLASNSHVAATKKTLRLLHCHEALSLLNVSIRNPKTDDFMEQLHVQLTHFTHSQQYLPEPSAEESAFAKLNYFASVKTPFNPFQELIEIIQLEQVYQAQEQEKEKPAFKCG